MKLEPIENTESLSIFSWHVNIYLLNKRKHILFMNDLSRLCVIVDGVRSSQLKVLKDKFLSTLSAYLSEEEINKSLINLYIKDGSEMIFSKTDNRSVLGTMKEITIYTTDTHLEFEDNVARMKWLNKLIYKPIHYDKPIMVFKEAIQKHYS